MGRAQPVPLRRARRVVLRRALFGAAVAVCAAHVRAADAAAQHASAWIDANAAHSAPPSGEVAARSMYGLLGARLRLERASSAFELGATTGRGADADAGGWLSGRAAFDASRVVGAFDAGLRVEGSGLTYLTPVRLDGDVEYTQSLVTGTVRPHAGLSIGRFRIGVEALYTRGEWRTEHSTHVLDGGTGLPLPGRDGDLQRRRVGAAGAVTIAGGSASIMRVFRFAALEARVSSYNAVNQIADGSYRGVDGTATLPIGPVDLSATARWWETPVQEPELAWHAGIGIAIGDGAYLQAVAGRSVPDPVYGSTGTTNISAGISMRLGRRALGPPAPAAVGAPSGTGRVVRFVLQRADARTVAVAGDFSGWELRALQRTGTDVWTLETVLEPGVYHYSFVVDGETWFVPASASGIVDDGFGRKNATLVVNASTDGAAS